MVDRFDVAHMMTANVSQNCVLGLSLPTSGNTSAVIAAEMCFCICVACTFECGFATDVVSTCCFQILLLFVCVFKLHCVDL